MLGLKARCAPPPPTVVNVSIRTLFTCVGWRLLAGIDSLLPPCGSQGLHSRWFTHRAILLAQSCVSSLYQLTFALLSMIDSILERMLHF